uniref:RecA family profile 1 domain-containing protein n=1 Tax=Chrysotila carterae TaxID=13221 RepID=A0A7S4ESE5_CHRCT
MATQAPRHSYAQRASSLARDRRHTRKLSTGCPLLDASLGGGLDARGITEIAGAAGVGKTQLVLQLMLQVQLPVEYGGLGGGAILLHSAPEQATTKRLRQLADAFSVRHSRLGAEPNRLLDHVTMGKVHSAEMLAEMLSRHLPQILATSRVRLLVVDSFGALFRAVDERGAALERSSQLIAHAHRLKQLSDDYDIAVVVTNEATDKPIEQIAAAAGDIAAPSLQSLSLVSCNRPSVTVSPIEAKACCTSGKMTLPALGLSWSSCINTRLFLTRREVYAPTPLARTAFQPLSSGACQRLPSPLRDAGAQAYASALSRVAHDAARWHEVPPLELTLDAGCRQTRVARTLHVLFSPRLPSGSCDFEILQEGVRGVDDGTRA